MTKSKKKSRPQKKAVNEVDIAMINDLEERAERDAGQVKEDK